MAGNKSVNRTARTLLIALASLLAIGTIGSLFLGVRAANQAKVGAVDQARSIVQNSLPLVLAPGDVTSPASDARADLITTHITPVVLDPTAYDTVTIWSTDGTIVYSTDRSLIGQRPEEFRTPVRDAITHGTVTSAMQNGSFSVLLPLRLRSDGPPSAAVELARSADLIVAAGQPWRYNAILMTIAFFLVGGLLYRLMRLTAAASQSASFLPASSRVAPAPTLPRIDVPTPGMREEAEARKKAEDRAIAAEERLNLIQDQYRKALEELHVTQRMVHDRPQPSAPDPDTETRLLKSDGQVRLLEGQLKAMSVERDKLARHIAEQAKSKATDPDVDRRTRQAEQETIGLRAELEGAQTELSVTRRELDALKAQAARAAEIQEDLDTVHVEAFHAREGMESANAELARANAELEEVRNEMRALRNEEQRAAVLSEELRAARAELDSLKASHRADLVEREADLEELVRRAREDFQMQLEEQRTQAERQFAEREAALAAEASSRTSSIERDAAEREAALQQEAAGREAELQHRLAEREATLQQEMAEQLSALEQRLLQREEELSSRAGGAEQKASAVIGELGTAKAELAKMRAELQAARDEIDAAVYDGSSRNEQVAKANEELLRSRTEIETLQQELAESARQRQHSDAQRAEVTRERDAAQQELVAASAEVQAELTRGVELAGRIERTEQELRSLREQSAHVTGELEGANAELERANAEQDRLTRALADAETHHAAELAAVEARLRPDTEAEEVLRASQERLASQTEKLIEVEERAHSSERQLADTIVHLEEVEAELRHLQMEKALHDLQSDRPTTERPATAELAVEAGTAEPLEDRRASTPFTKELALDAKKSLSHILGLTQIMKYKKDSKDQAQLIKQLTAAARRLDHTVADLAEADALAHGAVELTIKRTDLEALVKRVVEESGVGDDHDVRIDSQPLVVGVDALRVEQVLAGMLRNSVDRTPTGKAITVRLANHEGGALLSVEDTEPSSDASLSPVVRRFVEMQGGWTRVESRDGGGSAFRAFLPDGGPGDSANPPFAPEDTTVDTGQESDVPTTLQIVVGDPGEDQSAQWGGGGTEEQLFVQELHQLHAED